MGKPAKTFTVVLNRDQNWAYHEIITEALFVLWAGCHLSLKFGTRFFPEWEITRSDPDSYTNLDFLLWLLLRRNITGCVWDNIASPWKSYMPQTVTNPVITSREHSNAGYIGTFATVLITVLLGVSAACSAWVNRHWRVPRWTQHLRNCRRITTWLGYGTTSGGAGDLDFDEDPKTPEWRMVVFNILLLYASMSVFVGLWLVFCALPVVILVGLTIAFVGRHCGEEALFPTTAVCFCLLAVYCIGRIWGLWMNKTYFMQLHEIIRSATGMRLFVQPFAAYQEVAHETEAATDSSLPAKLETATDPSLSAKLEAVWSLWFTIILMVMPALYAVANHCVATLEGLPGDSGWMDPFSLLLFSLASGRGGSTSASGHSASGWTFTNCTECCDNYATGMSQTNAMLSYYIDLHQPRWTTRHPVILALFNTVISPVTERFYMAWMGILAWGVGLPMILLGLTGAACGVWQCFRGLISGLYQWIWKPKTNQDDPEDRKAETTSPDKPAVQTKKRPFCVCALWMGIERYILVVFSRCLFWTFIPFPVLVLMVPEQFLLPVWLLLLTIIEVGLYGWVWKNICWGYRELHTDCGDRAHPVKAEAEEDDASLLTA
ncbi:uncharacterized protein LOC129596975 [Paramacrobiotus metropolitanus]|uniref:uncharacterized protein LOC129596975 n=1 Tax=Paramacrobiotus metropolitanus TaxID=2943436 RepID=UPI0024456D06|nr:uncharacterized protein LOC129596975 [Paramacrobiotus metropolitanus]